MLTLIKREIEDAIIFFAITAFFAAILVSVLIYEVMTDQVNNPVYSIPSVIFLSVPLFLLLSVLSAVFGSTQMQLDRDRNRISFLSTLATTRRRILIAKLIAGLLWILLMFLPVAAAAVVLLRIFPRAVLPDLELFVKAFVALFLCSMACYAFGLQLEVSGKGLNKILRGLAVIFIAPALLSVFLIKGVGTDVILIYLLFAVFAILRAWQKFMSESF